MKAAYNYKLILREKIDLRKNADSRFNLKWIAKQLDIQYTYLSKVFNNDGAHFNNDHLYTLCYLLKLDPKDIDYILLLKEYEVSENQKHKDFILKKIQSHDNSYAIGPEVKPKQDSMAEMEYLFDPINILIHVGLSMKSYRNNPLLFCDKLNLTVNEVKTRLKLLERVGFILMEDSGTQIKDLTQHKIHFGKNHPLMRIHQTLVKNKINSKLLELKENEKESFMATFSFDDDAFEEAKTEFKNFFNKLVKIQGKSAQNKLYQLNFDLFKWF